MNTLLILNLVWYLWICFPLDRSLGPMWTLILRSILRFGKTTAGIVGSIEQITMYGCAVFIVGLCVSRAWIKYTLITIGSAAMILGVVLLLSYRSNWGIFFLTLLPWLASWFAILRRFWRYLFSAPPVV